MAHARRLELAGGSATLARALAQRDLDAAEAAGLDPARRKLLEFVEVAVKFPWRITDEQVEELRQTGFSDEQIFEASLNVAFFMFVTTMADVYGLTNPAPELIGEDVEAWERAGIPHQPA